MRRSSLVNQDRVKSTSKLSRRSAASTAQLLDSKKPIIGKPLPSSFRNLLNPSKKVTDSDTGRKENKKTAKAKDKKTNRYSEVQELKKAVKEREKESCWLNDKIKRFEKMFELLQKSLEEGEGIEEFIKISFFIQNEFTTLKLKNVGAITRRESGQSSVKDQLDTIKGRIENLIAYSKFKI